MGSGCAALVLPEASVGRLLWDWRLLHGEVEASGSEGRSELLKRRPESGRERSRAVAVRSRNVAFRALFSASQTYQGATYPSLLLGVPFPSSPPKNRGPTPERAGAGLATAAVCCSGMLHSVLRRGCQWLGLHALHAASTLPGGHRDAAPSSAGESEISFPVSILGLVLPSGGCTTPSLPPTQVFLSCVSVELWWATPAVLRKLKQRRSLSCVGACHPWVCMHGTRDAWMPAPS